MKLIKKIALSWVILLPCFSLTQAAVPGLEIQCGFEQSSGFHYGYCIHEMKGSVSKDVLFYFHGIGGSEYDWQKSDLLQKTYASWGIVAPAVISISYGSLWLLASQNTSRYSGLYEHFLKQALPKLEEKLKVHPQHRLLMGLSMGGFNASQIYLKNPELFSKIIFACPAISSLSPFADEVKVEAYVDRTHASLFNVEQANLLTRVYFPNVNSWSKADPLVIANQVITSQFPSIYVSCGESDEYGFFEGAKLLTDAAVKHGAHAILKLVPGKHCSYDAEAGAAFVIGSTQL